MTKKKPTIRQDNIGQYLIPVGIEDGICVDLGANVGSFSEFALQYFSLIHYYEPYTPCYNVCVEKFSQRENVVGFNEAISNANGTVSVVPHLGNSDSGSNSILQEIEIEEWDKDNVLQEVQSITLETVRERLGNREIDYLKSDIEASEHSVFMGQDLRDIKYIAIEIHWQLGKEKYDELVRYLMETHRLVASSDPMGVCTHYERINGEYLFQRLDLEWE